MFLHIGMTLDGYIDDDNHTVDWHFVDDEFEEYVNGILRSIDGMVFGRVAHESLSEYWPTAASNPDASPRHLEAIEMMNALPKYVVSNSGYQISWANSHVVSSDVAGFFRRLKEQPGKDIALFAGASVARSFIEERLLDEIRILVNPILLGSGTPLFVRGGQRVPLTLIDTRTFAAGAILLTYVLAQPDINARAL